MVAQGSTLNSACCNVTNYLWSDYLRNENVKRIVTSIEYFVSFIYIYDRGERPFNTREILTLVLHFVAYISHFLPIDIPRILRFDVRALHTLYLNISISISHSVGFSYEDNLRFIMFIELQNIQSIFKRHFTTGAE